MPSIQYTKVSPNTSYYYHHRRHNSLSGAGSSGHLHSVRPAARSTSGLGGFHSSSPSNGTTAIANAGALGVRNVSIKGMHQRSISMDDHDLMSARKKTVIGQNSRSVRGCNLCEDYHDDNYLHENDFTRSNDFIANDSTGELFYNHSDYPGERAIDDIFEEDSRFVHTNHDLHQEYSDNVYDEHDEELEEAKEKKVEKNVREEEEGGEKNDHETNQTDEVVDKIVNRIYEKIHSSSSPTKNSHTVSKKVSNSEFLKNDNLLISKLLASMALENSQNEVPPSGKFFSNFAVRVLD